MKIDEIKNVECSSGKWIFTVGYNTLVNIFSLTNVKVAPLHRTLRM